MPTSLDAAAHTADQEKKLVFKTQTLLVQVPVVVTDRSGTHVKGLEKGDFRVFENGKEQTISTFEEVAISTSPLQVAVPNSEYHNNERKTKNNEDHT
jgi:hypothetical protein